MEDWKAGMLAKAKAGHDKDQLYVIIKVEPEYVYLADGKKRTLDRPKKKNRRHVQIIKRASGELQTKFENGSNISSTIGRLTNLIQSEKKPDYRM